MLNLIDLEENGGDGDGRISELEFLGYFGGLGQGDNLTAAREETSLWTWTFLPLQVDLDFLRLSWDAPSTEHRFEDFQFYRGAKDRLKKDLVIDSRRAADRRHQRAASLLVMLGLAIVGALRFVAFFCPCCLGGSGLCGFAAGGAAAEFNEYHALDNHFQRINGGWQSRLNKFDRAAAKPEGSALDSSSENNEASEDTWEDDKDKDGYHDETG